MPFMDAYHAPYKKESHYWTGFILLVHSLFLTFAFNTLGNASANNLLAVTSVTTGLAASAWVDERGNQAKFANTSVNRNCLSYIDLYCALSCVHTYVQDINMEEATRTKF